MKVSLNPLSAHCRTQSELTERRDSAYTTRDSSPKPEGELILQRNIIILAEKQKIFDQREQELLRVQALLFTKKRDSEAEVSRLAQEVTKAGLRSDQLTARIDLQRKKRELARKNTAQLPQPERAAVHRRQPDDLSRLKQRVLQAGEQLLVQQQSILAKATEVKNKERRLKERRTAYCAQKQLIEQMKKQLADVNCESEALEEGITVKNDALKAGVKAAALTREQINEAERAAESRADESREVTAALEAAKEELTKKKAQLAQLRSEVTKKESLVAEQQVRIQTLLQKEDELEQKVRGHLSSDSHWKSLNFQDMRQILDTVHRIREKETRVHTSQRRSSHSVCR